MTEDVRTDTSKIEVVSAKDNNKLLKDIAEVVDSTNPFVAKGQSKTLKDGSNYYLLTDPKYNWYKEVAQDCFAYKDGTTTKTERVSAKGYRPDISKVRLSKTVAKGADETGTICRDNAKNELYFGDAKGEKVESIPNSADKYSFYVLMEGAGGNGGGCGMINGKGAGGGGSGAWSVINITIPTNYNGIICRVHFLDNGSLELAEGPLINGTKATVELLSCGIEGESQSGLLEFILWAALTVVGFAFYAAVGVATGGVTMVLGGAIVMVSAVGAIGAMEEFLKQLPAGSGGKMMHEQSYERGVERNGIKYKIIKCGNGSNGGGSSGKGENCNTSSIADNPENIALSASNKNGGTAGSNDKPLFVTYHGGGGGGASIFADGGNGGNAQNGRGSNGEKGSGAGGGAAGWGYSSGGTGGSAYMEIRF